MIFKEYCAYVPYYDKLTIITIRWIVATCSAFTSWRCLYLDIPRPELPVDNPAGGYGHEGEAYEDEYYGEEEAYGFASWGGCEGLDNMETLVETVSSFMLFYLRL